jgi:G3E family GTPase
MIFSSLNRLRFMGLPPASSITGGFQLATAQIPGRRSLSHVLRDPQGLKLAVLVNDLGAVNIDAEILGEASEDVVPLENGCICCSLSQGLLATVTKVLRRPDPPDRILIEASGVSDPFEIAEILSDPELRPYAPLDGIVAVVDAERMRDPDPEILPLARRQVACAGLVLLNKVDLAEGGEAAHVWVRSVAGTVPIMTTKHAAVTLPTLFGIGLESGATTDGAAVPSFDTTTFKSTDPISLKRLHALFAALPHGIVRIKGILDLVEKPEHRCLLQVSGGRATVTIGQPWGDEGAETRLVIIGLSGSVDAPRIADALDSCLTPEIEPARA